MRRVQGLTLIEAVIALAILAVVMVGVIAGFASFSQANTRMELRSGAVAAAQQVLDELRTGGTWPASMTVDSGLRTYQVAINVCATGTSGCRSSATARHVRLEVSHEGTIHYEVETVYTQFD